MLVVYNGNVGTVENIVAETGEISVRLDAPRGREGRLLTWRVKDFNAFRHGYAGTIHKSQGKTLDSTYLYHTRHWSAAPSYVALTRQREDAKIFVARETAPDRNSLARQMARTEIRSASIAWSTHEELRRDLDLAAGRSRFRDEYAARREERQALAGRDAQLHDLVTNWDRLFNDYAREVPRLEGNPDYERARDQLTAFGRSLQERPELLAALRENGQRFGLMDRPVLYGVAQSPERVVETIAAYCEAIQGSERERQQVAARRALPLGRAGHGEGRSQTR
jgi:hypothetical protein